MKLNSKILKIKLFYLKYSGRIKKNERSLDFSISNSEIDNILFIFPIKEETYRVASYVFRDLIVNSDSSHHFIINRIHYSAFAKKGNLYGMNYFKSKDKIIFDDKIEDDGILKKKFSVVIDLNDEFIYDIALFLNKLDADYKIGIKNKYSDLFYNIQFTINQSNILENGYKQINQILNKQ
tara:strand:- start:238 stop:777 length:540 start_codon:yes stop_codon:yes gene_type:complete